MHITERVLSVPSVLQATVLYLVRCIIVNSVVTGGY